MTSNGERRRSHWKWARWLTVAISVGGVIYLLAWYVPDVLVRHKADTSVESAWISAVAILLGVGATAAVAIFAFWYSRSTNQATIKGQGEQLDKTLAAQGEQLDSTLAAQREQLNSTLAEQHTRALNERFAAAAGQLGGDKPPAVRLAGVYAMAGLADDWPENLQTCVDVLCGYLRLPYEPDPGEDAPRPERLAFRAGREVRHTLIRVIAAHLRDDAAVSWQGRDFDFTDAVFDGGDFSSARFSGGSVSFLGAQFSGGRVSFEAAGFSAGAVSFSGAVFLDGVVSFSGAGFSGGYVDFESARFVGGGVDFEEAEFSGGEVSFGDAQFSGGEVRFHSAQFSSGLVSFRHAGFAGSTVDFWAAWFGGGTVDFAAGFFGGLVSFRRAGFGGGTVDFSDAADWSHPPEFDWEGTPPPGVKLPNKGSS